MWLFAETVNACLALTAVKISGKFYIIHVDHIKGRHQFQKPWPHEALKKKMEASLRKEIKKKKKCFTEYLLSKDGPKSRRGVGATQRHLLATVIRG